MLYKVTYNLVIIYASQYLTHNTRLSKHIHPLIKRQIPTFKDYYRFTFFQRSIVHWNALPTHQYTSPSQLHTIQQCYHCNEDPCLTLNSSFCFHLLTFFALYQLVSPFFKVFLYFKEVICGKYKNLNKIIKI